LVTPAGSQVAPMAIAGRQVKPSPQAMPTSQIGAVVRQ
jgi:hypothetical protein